MHIERVVSSPTIPFKFGETIKVRDGRGRIIETLMVLDNEPYGKKEKRLITFRVNRHPAFGITFR